MFEQLAAVNACPALYATTTTPELWSDPHISGKMLAAHLDPNLDLSSYRTAYVEQAVAWMIDSFGIGEGVRVADFGCGPGLYTTRLARTGAEVTGLDLSTRSLDHARSLAAHDGLPVRHLLRNYLTYREATRYDLIIMIMRDYCALAPDGRAALLRTVREHLAPGGSFVFDVDSAAAFAGVTEQASYAPALMDGFWSDQPYFGFHNTFRYEHERVSLDTFAIVEAERQRVFFNWVRYFTPEELTAELVAAGFTGVRILGDLTGAPYDDRAPHFTACASPRPAGAFAADTGRAGGVSARRSSS
ncbi:SAM-dependent methyltransferase [Streptomyces genisteinicus]|uniref:SAM-dependent methyltransferase n=1 Tax=Streptomyces genisteinicus TaxID=2768068 RepID=UPI001FE6D219|nr:class I SAM-dependent methyltransferase [Streptomyces genisteinicus]